MVTAIVIPIICLYFFWLTRKEMKEHEMKWLASAHMPKDSVLTGEIKGIYQERQRFYYHRFLFVQELQLHTEGKIIIAKKMTPIRKGTIIDPFTIGETIRVYGSWEGNQFLFSQYQLLNPIENT